MPRLAHALIRDARAEHPYLPLLLLASRDLATARRELRQLEEYVADCRKKGEEQVRERQQARSQDQCKAQSGRLAGGSLVKTPCLLELCKQRALGKPVPYIRGSEPFGCLEMLCEKGALIPRQTTANYTQRTAELLIRRFKPQVLDGESSFSILDLCTGSGCIPLLLHALLAPHFAHLKIIGTDLSEDALKIGKKNLIWNLRRGNLEGRAAKEITFVKHNILETLPAEFGEFDLVISNPPYATPEEYASSAISKSVRRYEPIEAILAAEDPDAGSVSGHTYFTAIESIAQRVGANMVVLEMGLEEQFAHVCNKLQALPYWYNVEVWRDQVYSGLLGGEPRTEIVKLSDTRGLEIEVGATGIGLYRVVVGITEKWRWVSGQLDCVEA